MTVEQWRDLKPNRLLLDNEFEGYRLSLAKLASYDKTLTTELLVLKLPLHQYSLQHVKTFTFHNHLVQERWNDSVLYFITKELTVNSVLDSPEVTALNDPVEVYHGSFSPEESTVDIYNPSLSFPSKSLVFLSDGRGKIELLHSGKDRTEQLHWKVLHTLTREQGCILYDSLCIENEATASPYILLLTGHVEETEDRKHCSVVSCITFSLNSNGEWEGDTTQVYKTQNVEYVSVDDTAHIYIASSSHTYADGKEIGDGDKMDVTAVDGAEEGGEVTAAPRYIWLQADDDITLTFALEADTVKADVEVVFSRSSLCVTVKGRQLLVGSLHRPIATGECTWTIAGTESKCLDVFVSKADPSWWAEFIAGDTQGEMVTDPEVAERIHQNLDYLTSDRMEGGNAKPAINNQGLEACDLVGNDSTFLCRLNLTSKTAESIVNLTGCNWLYSRVASQSAAASFCTRHDVDGLVWTPTPPLTEPAEHVATFNALGYVQASKENRRFISSPDDHSYVAIADAEKHIYVYRQPKALDTDVRNRRTGRALQHVSEQQVVSLDSAEAIHGFCTVEHSIYALTSCKLYKFKV